MAPRRKRPGKGAECTVLTRFIHPLQSFDGDRRNHRSAVVLISRDDMMVNRKMRTCYTFRISGGPEDGPICHAAKSHFRIEKEGRKEDLFDPPVPQDEADDFREPKVKWRKSEAKRILYDMILDGVVPLDLDDVTMTLEQIYSLHEEFCKYSYSKFGSRLKALKENIIGNTNRAEEDLASFEDYISNHTPSLYSHKGYIQWQGSSAQEYLLDDLPEYVNNPNMKPYDLWMSREEYRDEYPLHAFRDKIKQEIRTAKYLRTLKERGTHYRAS